MSSLEVGNLSLQRGSSLVVNDVSFYVDAGKIATLLGPSGCGKTSTLRCIAGLEQPVKGEISIGGKLVTSTTKNVNAPPERRNVGMVFQSYALWPHMSVFDIVALPLRLRKVNKSEIETRVNEVLVLVGLPSQGDRYPHELSGGQQQRVALARALVYKPNVLLLDEPLSNLDARLRESMRSELFRLHKKTDVTMVYVTHDLSEALALSDIICVMNEGKILQTGTPADIFEKPTNKFTADFMGSNLIEGALEHGKEHHDGLNDNVVTDWGGMIICSNGLNEARSDKVFVSIRPEYVEISKDGSRTAPNTFPGEISEITYDGSKSHVLIRLGKTTLKAICSDIQFVEGEKAFVTLPPKHCFIQLP